MNKDSMITTDRCFMCGKKNPIGIKMDIKCGNGEAFSMVNLNKNYEGYNGHIHGGIITALLDEIAVYAAYSINKVCVTYEINVKFKKPVSSEKNYNVYGNIVTEKGKIIICNSKIYDEKNIIFAEADVKLFLIE